MDESKLPYIVGPASFLTVDTIMVLDCFGKVAVKSRGEVMNVPSVTGLIGIKAPADASKFAASWNSANEISVRLSVEIESRQPESEASQPSLSIRLLLSVSNVLVERNP